MTINVLFVCAGNICRSPMADAVFQQMIRDAGLESRFRVDSAGVGAWHIGERAHRGTRDVLKRHKIPYDGRARQFRASDAADFDYILAMDQHNLSGIRSVAGAMPNTTIAMFLSYANKAGLTVVTDTPDPYYSDRFDEVYELVTLGCRALLDHIRATHDL